MKRQIYFACLVFTLLFCGLGSFAFAQKPEPKAQVRTVTIPISIFTKKELKDNQAEEYVQADRLVVKEDNDEQQILSIRSVSDTPLSVALLIQDDLTSDFNLQLKEIQEFITRLPKGTRVMVAYSRSGSPQIRQKFTDDLEKASKSLRIVSGSAGVAPRSPYDSVDDLLGKFDAVPGGRRAIIMFSDGLDVSEGLNLASITQSVDLERAALKAQRKGVAIYSIYAPTALTQSSAESSLGFAAQGALAKFSDEAGGRAFFSGTQSPVTLLPFFRDMMVALNRQFALTYLSTHMKKGYHSVNVRSTNPDVKIEHPRGYYYR
jgi:VWFA-related protein